MMDNGLHQSGLDDRLGDLATISSVLIWSWGAIFRVDLALPFSGSEWVGGLRLQWPAIVAGLLIAGASLAWTLGPSLGSGGAGAAALTAVLAIIAALWFCRDASWTRLRLFHKGMTA